MLRTHLDFLLHVNDGLMTLVRDYSSYDIGSIQTYRSTQFFHSI